jgi:hypothetical protein
VASFGKMVLKNYPVKNKTIRVNPNLIWLCPYKKGKLWTQRHAHKKKTMWIWRQRSEGYTHTSQGMPRIASKAPGGRKYGYIDIRFLTTRTIRQ